MKSNYYIYYQKDGYPIYLRGKFEYDELTKNWIKKDCETLLSGYHELYRDKYANEKATLVKLYVTDGSTKQIGLNDDEDHTPKKLRSYSSELRPSDTLNINTSTNKKQKGEYKYFLLYIDKYPMFIKAYYLNDIIKTDNDFISNVVDIFNTAEILWMRLSNPDLLDISIFGLDAFKDCIPSITFRLFRKETIPLSKISRPGHIRYKEVSELEFYDLAMKYQSEFGDYGEFMRNKLFDLYFNNQLKKDRYLVNEAYDRIVEHNQQKQLEEHLELSRNICKNLLKG